MNRWKTIAMMSMGFTCGVVWTAACGGADSAKADDSGYGGARTVLELLYSTSGSRCFKDTYDGMIGEDCCPPGFTFVGIAERGGDEGQHQVCLQDAS